MPERVSQAGVMGMTREGTGGKQKGAMGSEAGTDAQCRSPSDSAAGDKLHQNQRFKEKL